MRTTLVTAPSSEPVTTAKAKLHLRVDHSDEDTHIDDLVAAARRMIEQITRRALITQTWKRMLDTFPISEQEIELPWAPLQSVSSVAYTDADGNSQTWSSANYQVDTDSEPGRLALEPATDWPATESGRVNAVTITYVCGYGDVDDVPQALKQAILLLVGHWYANRESVLVGTVSKEIEQGLSRLLWLYKVPEVDS